MVRVQTPHHVAFLERYLQVPRSSFRIDQDRQLALILSLHQERQGVSQDFLGKLVLIDDEQRDRIGQIRKIQADVRQVDHGDGLQMPVRSECEQLAFSRQPQPSEFIPEIAVLDIARFKVEGTEHQSARLMLAEAGQLTQVMLVGVGPV